jgi:HPt (histidine-containing phosphotransfer) domain-containing protein
MLKLDMNTFNSLKESTGADFIGELIDAFLDDAPGLIEKMKTSLSAGDAENFRRATHSMKSNAATFGCMELAELARELEAMGRDNNLQIGNRLAQMEEALHEVESQLRALK